MPLYCIVSLGCYGLLMVGVGLMRFPTCPHEAILLQENCYSSRARVLEVQALVESSSTRPNYIDEQKNKLDSTRKRV
ncbi:hypothetical protein ACS0TY_026068 [Phlomoides rotata]